MSWLLMGVILLRWLNYTMDGALMRLCVLETSPFLQLQHALCVTKHVSHNQLLNIGTSLDRWVQLFNAHKKILGDQRASLHGPSDALENVKHGSE